MKKKKLIFISFILIFIFTASAIPCFITINLLNRINIKPKEPVSDKYVTDISSSDSQKSLNSPQIINILFLGIDSQDKEPGRSDCIMIFSLDQKHNKIKLLSIPRDSYVTISSLDTKDKINHAYSYGGPAFSIDTVNNNFNLDISSYISVNFSTFPKLIDSIGGIELTITEDEIEFINDYIDSVNELNSTNSNHINKAGTMKVDGTQALAYSRIRYTHGDDFKRTQRHRIIINQIINKIKSLPLTQYYSLLNNNISSVETNLSKYEIISYFKIFLSLHNAPVIEERFPCDEDSSGKLINGVYYYVFNEDNTIKKIHNFIYEE